MKKYFVFLLFFFSTTVFSAIKTATPADQLAQLLSQFTTLKTNFSQTTVNAEGRVLQKSDGVMMVMKPNHFRFETLNPTHQIVITSGKTLWIYDVDLAQATEQSIEKLPMNPAKLLSGDVSALLDAFSVVATPHQNDVWVFKLTPKKTNDAFRSITIMFKREKLDGMQIQSNIQQSTTFSFSNTQMNPVLPQTLFQFKVPAGVDVLK